MGRGPRREAATKNRASPTSRYGGGDGNGLDYRVYAKGFTRGPEYHQDGRNFDDWRAVQGGFRMDWTMDPRDNLTVQGDVYKEEAGERVTATSYTPPYSQNIDANADLSGGNFWPAGPDLGDGNDIQLQAYYDRTSRYEAKLRRNSATPTISISCSAAAGGSTSFPGAWERGSAWQSDPRLFPA